MALVFACYVGVLELNSDTSTSNFDRQIHTLDGHYSRNVDGSSKRVAKPSRSNLSVNYEAEGQKGDCPVCLENTDIIKPFRCDHGVCENCFEGMQKAHNTGNTYDMEFDGQIVHINYPVHLVCPQCRAESKTQIPTQ